MNVLRAEDVKSVKAGPSIAQDNKVSMEKNDKVSIRGDNKMGIKRQDNKVGIKNQDNNGIDNPR